MNLKYEKKDIYSNLTDGELQNADKLADEYIEFVDKSKTEYLCIENAIEILKKNGFKNIEEVNKLQKSMKVYFVNKEKSLYAAVIGKDKLVNGVNMVGAHVDCPRLDLKPMPLYEKNNAALLKTQFYGGIKKYQWMSIPLAMYGVIYDKDGNKINIRVGDTSDTLCFTIADLLPHLSYDQMKLKANDFIDPEKMSILIGSNKDIEEKDSKNKTVKNNILKILNKKYNITEIDFARSEISFVPAFSAKYVGFDKSMIGAYGQDDRVCAYTTLKAITEIDSKKLNKTSIALLVDKEEIGSFGNTSMSSLTFDMFMNKLLKLTGEDADLLEVYYNSKMLSADVSTCVDPVHDEVSDIQNGNMLGCGIALEKYTGSGGKYNASDANAKYVSEVMQIFEKNNVFFQLGTLGKIGKGGGGTIAYKIKKKGVDVIDCGTPVLAMHSPFEVTSKYDVYMTYRAYKVFFEN